MLDPLQVQVLEKKRLSRFPDAWKHRHREGGEEAFFGTVEDVIDAGLLHDIRGHPRNHLVPARTGHCL